MSVKEKVNTFLAKLPFKGMAEKIPAATRTKFPILGKAIPFANHIVCGLAAALLVTVIACSGGKKESGSSGGSAKASSGGGKAVVAPASDFEYDLTKDGKGVALIKYKGPGGDIIVPSEIEGMPVTQLGGDKYDFTWRIGNVFNNTKVTSVVFPDSIKDYNCEGMFGHSSLREITIPEWMTVIPKMWFDNAGSLTSVTLPDTLKEIGEFAFRSTNLDSVVIPNGVTKIDEQAFAGCKNLKSVTLPDSIQEIDFWAFKNCGNLETINNVPSRKIYYSGIDSFSGCSKLSLTTRKAIQDTGYTGTFN